MLFSRTLRVLPIVAVCLLGACATGDAGDTPCESDADCPAGKNCDLEQSICVQASISTTNNRTIPDTNPNNRNNGQTNNGETNNGTTQTTGNNTTGGTNNGSTTSTNNNTGGNNTTGTNGSTCTPACDAPATCQNGTCVLPDCGAVGDPCNPLRPSQNGFTCVDIEGDGICAEPCDRPLSASSCSAGEYCFGYMDGGICLAGDCDTNADCTDGTCLNVDNGFQLCVDAGPLSPGDPCDPASDTAQCGVGEACDSTGSCEPLCDLHGGTCAAANHYCSVPVSAQTGLCTHDTLATTQSPFSSCDSPGSACNDGSMCLSLDADNAACLAFCRPGENDCAGISFNAGSTVCNDYVYSVPGLGLCWPPCSAGDCGTGATCIDQRCRVACTPGNEVTDCCDGDPDCPAYCNPTTQLCE